MIFNGKHLCEYFIINDIKRDILPPQELTLKEIPGMRGARFIKKRHGIGLIEVDVTIVEHNATDFRKKTRHIASLLDVPEPAELRFTDEVDKYYLAILDGDADLNEVMMIGEGTLRFICPDPIAYGEVRRVHISDGAMIFNRGTYKTSGTITIDITKDTDHIKATLLNTGEFVYVEHDFEKGDIVTINLAGNGKNDEMVYKNGHSIMKDCYLESDFFEIPVGEFKITISGGDAIIEYVERWL